MGHALRAWPRSLAFNIYGLYNWLPYLTPLIGGLPGDRLFGQRVTVVMGSY